MYDSYFHQMKRSKIDHFFSSGWVVVFAGLRCRSDALSHNAGLIVSPHLKTQQGNVGR
jgi:hypothetical protein